MATRPVPPAALVGEAAADLSDRRPALLKASGLRRAVLSVSDKSGIVVLARALAAAGIEILSTGGTAKHLSDAGIAVTPISTWSGAPEILGGRVKTLTPKVFGAILHDRDNPAHLADCERQGIPPVDLVVVNLYPFETTVARGGVSIAEAIEQIDVGGPSMLRAAAKNHRHVLPLCDPSLYAPFLEQLAAGKIADDFRQRCATLVFRLTSRYDAAIAGFLGQRAEPAEPSGSPEEFPATLALRLEKLQDLRYGENPQQGAAFYRTTGTAVPFEQLHGKELSYNNLIDLDAALKLASAFADPAAVVIKHTNPCGVGRDPSPAGALRLALDADPLSAFGGIIALNRELDDRCAAMLDSIFLEVIVAPSFSAGAVAVLGKKKNLRLVRALPTKASFEVRSAAGGILAQSVDRLQPSSEWNVVSKRAPTAEELRGLEFAWIVSAHVKSNAIVLTTDRQSIGIGAGQMSRVDAARVAIMKALVPTSGSVAASDAFFPFRDGLDLLGQAGVTAVIQPGGSVRDAEVIAAADEQGLAMVFTGRRHFRH
jgi:phosphoribosylaminoimidazolecarboxamide formyltransferase/IMP cyclohydrolase